jgi:predicted AAA+ superfamily ATPase
VQEKLSLADRFGLSIGYFSPTPREYDNIVQELAARYPEIDLDPEVLKTRARAWELRHGGYSGRTAQQFINYLVGVECSK